MAESSPKDTRGNSPIFKLTKLQRLLKNENELNSYYDENLKNIPSQMEKEYENYLHTNKIILSYYLYSINNNGLNLNPLIFESLRSNSLGPDKRPVHIKYNTSITTKYKKFLECFSKETERFALICSKLLSDNESMTGILTFSVIPSFFAFFSTKDKIAQFLSFMRLIFKNNESTGYTLSRVVFLLPDFRFFFSKIIQKINMEIEVLTVEEIPTYVTKFCNCFQKYVELCPNVIKTLLKISPSKSTFLKESFLIPAFTHLRQYGLISYNSVVDKRVEDQLRDSIISKSQILSQMIEESDNLPSLATVGSIENVSPNVEKMYLFTYDDLLCINIMTGLMRDEGSQIEPIKDSLISEPNDFSVFVLKFRSKEEEIPDSSVQLSSIDELENCLRNILKQINNISAAVVGSTIEDVINKQTLLFSEEKRLRFQLKVEDLNRCLQRVVDDGKNFSFEELIDLMKKRFDERNEERKNEVVMLSRYATQIKKVISMRIRLEATQKNQLLEVFQYQLIERWNEEKHPLSLIDNSVFESSQDFVNCFSRLAKNFDDWLISYGYQKAANYAFLYNFVMSEIPLNKFIANRPELVEKDRALYNYIKNNQNELLDETCESWMKPLLSNPKLVEPLTNIMKNYYLVKTPLDKFVQMNKLREKTDQIVNREGETEVGADQQIPMILMTMIMSKPEHYISNIEYIEYFYDNLSKSFNILVDSQTEYSFNVFKSLIEQFKKKIDI